MKKTIRTLAFSSPLLFITCTVPVEQKAPINDVRSDITAEVNTILDAGNQNSDAGNQNINIQLRRKASQYPISETHITCEQDIPDEPKVLCSMMIISNNGEEVYNGNIAIELRGRSSLTFPKKQYGLELRKENGEDDNPKNLFGMGKEEDWILNGLHIDRSLVRNAFFYDLYAEMATLNYSPEVRYTNLTINNEYLGIYNLSEKLKRDSKRIAITRDTEENGSSFIIKQDVTNSEGSIGNVYIANGSWQMVYPKKRKLTQNQQAGIQSKLAQWKEYTLNRDARVFDLVDIDNAVDYVILQEIAKNNDAYYLSMHLWSDQGSKIHFALWDLDLSIGQPLYNDSVAPQRWIQQRPPLIHRMAIHPEFQQRLSQRYRELRQTILRTEQLLDSIDNYVEVFSGSINANFSKWPISEIKFNGRFLTPVNNHAQEIIAVKNWLRTRLHWMDSNIDNYYVHPIPGRN